MKTKIIALLLLLPSAVFGQNGLNSKIAIQWSNKKTKNAYFLNNSNNTQIIDMNSIGYFVVNTVSDNTYSVDAGKNVYLRKMATFLKIEHYDNNLNLLNNKKVSWKHGKSKTVCLSIFKKDDKIYVLYSLLKNNAIDLYINTLNLESLKLNPTNMAKKVSTLNIKDAKINDFDNYVGSVNISYSPNKEYILLRSFDFINSYYTYKVIDINLKKSKKYYKTKWTDAVVDNFGNIHFTIWNLNRKTKKKNGSFFIESHIKNSNLEIKTQINENGLILHSPSMKIDNQNNLVLLGVYYSKINRKSGIYIIKKKLQEDLIVFKKFNLINESVLKNYENRRFIKDKVHNKASHYIEYGGISKIFEKKDGGYILFSENTYKTRKKHISASRMNPVYRYHTEDLIIVDMNKEGGINWTKRISKNQSGVHNDYWASFVFKFFNKDLYVFFNDHELNNKIIDKGYPVNFEKNKKEGELVYVKINEGGKMERKSLFKLSNIKMYLNPAVTLSHNNKLFIIANSRSKQLLGKITIK